MTARENVHQLVDALPEDRLADAQDYLAELNESGGLSVDAQTALEEGLEDIRKGHTISLDEYRRTRGL
jgi:hypothetical protein